MLFLIRQGKTMSTEGYYGPICLHGIEFLRIVRNIFLKVVEIEEPKVKICRRT